MVPLKYSNIVEHDREHRLMVCPHADFDHWVNPKGYKFNFDHMSYYKECGDVPKGRMTGNPDLTNIRFLDYKLTDKVVDNPLVWKFLDKWFELPHNKILHLVNFWEPLIPSKIWDSFCDYYDGRENVFLDIHNKNPSESVEICMEELLKIKGNWLGIDYTHLDANPKQVAIKNQYNENIGLVLENPKLWPYGRSKTKVEDIR